MLIVACSFHTRFQQTAMVDTTTGAISERRLEHASGESRAFYTAPSGPAGVGMKATSHFWAYFGPQILW
jgi:hypothetical protein